MAFIQQSLNAISTSITSQELIVRTFKNIHRAGKREISKISVSGSEEKGVKVKTMQEIRKEESHTKRKS